MPDGVLIEVIDDGSDGTPVVKRDLLTTNGHGLYLVQQLAAQWGYLRDAAGTTVWFHLSPMVARRRVAIARLAAVAVFVVVPVVVVVAAAAETAASTPEQIAATSSSPVTYGGIV